jgi:hypothetical protein
MWRVSEYGEHVSSPELSAYPDIPTDPGLKALEQEVERRLGRCMIRLQRYEGLLKAMLAVMDIKGEPHGLDDALLRRQGDLHRDTLGLLVKQFTEDFLVTGSEAPIRDEKGVAPAGAAGWAKLRFHVQMKPEQLAETKRGLEELRDFRNDLVHHLLERFDLRSTDGCRLAAVHLDVCYETIGVQFKFLKALAGHLEQARAAMAMALDSPSFEEAFLHGIGPDGTVAWPHSTIVECLRNAETACGSAGWTALDDAIGWIGNEHPDQIPSRYGCKIWRQVLGKASCFDIRRTLCEVSKAGKTWYRTKAAA